MYIKSVDTGVCSAVSPYIAGSVLILAESYANLSHLHLWLLPSIAFHHTSDQVPLLAVCYCLDFSKMQLTEPGPCPFLHVFSRLAVPVLYIPDAFVMCWNSPPSAP